METTDSLIVKLLKDGNQQVFESVYEKFFGQLFIYAREYVLDSEVASEIVQDTFLKLWEIRKTIVPDTTLQSFLYRIARNNCLNYLKNIKVQEKYRSLTYSQKIEIALNFGALNDSSAEKIISDELEKKINDTIESLPSKCKQIFLMSRFEEKKYREIANELSISEKTVENHILKALKVMRKHLSEYLTSFLMLLSHFF